MKPLPLLALVTVALTAFAGAEKQREPADPSAPKFAGRVVFLGDSITDAGHYISVIETRLRQKGVIPIPELINLGLPSETCSGLSEPIHPFPRPEVHERLDRVLAKAKPDMVVACYGMNDAIYYPFSEERFQAYLAGVNKLIEKVQASGAKLVLLTPPPFDPVPMREKGKLLPAGAKEYSWKTIYEDYDGVLAKYAEWVLAQGERVDAVIDLRTPVLVAMAEARKADPKFSFSHDGVHLNQGGHTLMASGILDALGYDAGPAEGEDELLKLVHARQVVLHRAWVSHVGHKRPGVKAGLPLKEAEAKAAELELGLKRARAQ